MRKQHPLDGRRVFPRIAVDSKRLAVLANQHAVHRSANHGSVRRQLFDRILLSRKQQSNEDEHSRTIEPVEQVFNLL